MSASYIEWLLRCTAADSWTARKGRWLSTILLGLIGLVVLLFVAGFFAPGSGVAGAQPISAGLALILIGLYGLNRRGAVTAAASAVIGIYSAGILGTLYLVPIPLPNVALTLLLLLPMIPVAGLFLTGRVAGGVVLFQMGHAAWFYSYAPLPVLVEFRTAHPGILNPLSFSVTMLIGMIGVVGWVENRIVRDWITELEKVVAQRTTQLAAATTAAEAANLAKSAFIADLSHELRTPLTVIIGYSALALEDAQARAAPELADQAAQIHSAGSHALALLDTLLDLSKIDAGKTTIQRETFSVQDLTRAITTNFRVLLEQNGNEFQVECAPDLPALHSDPVKVRQILFNLLSNAGKFTTQGRITFTVQELTGDPTRAARPGWIQFEVRDTGIGMTADQVARLFQDYEQTDPGISERYGGIGLGLALSRRLARLLGGDITVTSQPGVGSSFTLLLPGLISQPRAARADPTGASLPTTREGELGTL